MILYRALILEEGGQYKEALKYLEDSKVRRVHAIALRPGTLAKLVCPNNEGEHP